jgi:hypothetical protein
VKTMNRFLGSKDHSSDVPINRDEMDILFCHRIIGFLYDYPGAGFTSTIYVNGITT